MVSVLHVISGLGLGGAERMLTSVAGGLQQAGMPQHVVSLSGRGPYAAELETAGVAVTAFDLKSVQGIASALWRLRRLVQALAPDVIQGWMYHGDLAASAAHGLASRRTARRLFWNIRASNIDTARYGRLIRVEALLSRWPACVIANSRAGARVHRDRGYRPRRLVVIPNGIDVERNRPDPELRRLVRAELGLGDQVVVIHAARVDPIKDHATFISAMRRVPAVTGLLVGAGTEQLVLPDNVRALGARRDLERMFAAADLVVSSSAFGEGFSNVLAEGMSAGLAPISTDVGDAATIIGDTGRIVPIGDAAALAGAIAADAALAPDHRGGRGLAARTRIIERFSRARMLDAYEHLYADDRAPADGP